MAQSDAIDSNVIHDYTQVGIGYGFLNDIGNSGENAHGIVGGASYDLSNFILGAGGGYFWGQDDSHFDTWNIFGAVGYVFRVMDDHLNIIPNASVAYTETRHEVNEASTTAQPGIQLSYAFNNKFAIHGGYNYAFELDNRANVDEHIFNVGADYALSDSVGLGVTGFFVDDLGFTGLTAGLSYHF